MVEHVRKLTGRQPIIIDPATLGEKQSEPDPDGTMPLKRQSIIINPATVGEVQPQSDPDGTTPLKVFISYSHQDEKMRERLGRHLAPIVDQGIFNI